MTGGGEQGLLSLAFAPDYTESGRVLRLLHGPLGRPARRRVPARDAPTGPTPARPGSSCGWPTTRSNHNGGQLAFGPDGLLYIGTGDGGGGGDRHGPRGNAQDLGSLLGKILRIEPTAAGGNAYARARARTRSSPAAARAARSTPTACATRGASPSTAATGALAIGDVGQGEWEEIDYVRRGGGKGANFGWRPFEGRARYTPGEPAPGHVEPVIVQSHATGTAPSRAACGSATAASRCAAATCSATSARAGSTRRSSRRGKASNVKPTALQVPSLSSFGEDARGRVYVASLNGPVYRIAPK